MSDFIRIVFRTGLGNEREKVIPAVRQGRFVRHLSLFDCTLVRIEQVSAPKGPPPGPRGRPDTRPVHVHVHVQGRVEKAPKSTLCECNHDITEHDFDAFKGDTCAKCGCRNFTGHIPRNYQIG